MQEFLTSLFIDWPSCLLTYLPLLGAVYGFAPADWVKRLPAVTIRRDETNKVETPEEAASDYVESLNREQAAIDEAQRALDLRRANLQKAKATGLAVLKGGEA